MSPKTAVDEAEKAPPTSKFPAAVEEADEMNPPSNMERPETESVEDAESAPPMFRLLVNVEEADEMSPPLASTLKSVLAVESTKRRKSPV